MNVMPVLPWPCWISLPLVDWMAIAVVDPFGRTVTQRSSSPIGVSAVSSNPSVLT
jgi:hypothetical protein